MRYGAESWEWVCPECGAIVNEHDPPDGYRECRCQMKKREQKRMKRKGFE